MEQNQGKEVRITKQFVVPRSKDQRKGFGTPISTTWSQWSDGRVSSGFNYLDDPHPPGNTFLTPEDLEDLEIDWEGQPVKIKKALREAKILRVIQERKIKPVGDTRYKDVDVRIIAATHKDLKKAIREDRFREDLYYRLSVIPIMIPAQMQI